jgi:hypothetical protein
VIKKRCWGCGQMLPLAQFKRIDGVGTAGTAGDCRLCQAASRNPDAVQRQAVARRLANQARRARRKQEATKEVA